MGFPFSIIEDFFRTIAILALFGILYLIGQGILNLIWKPIDKMEEKKKQKKVALSNNLSKDNSKGLQPKKRKKVAKKTTNTKNKNLKWVTLSKILEEIVLMLSGHFLITPGQR